MFKIGEFSKLTQVTIRMLRYYDEMGLLKPAEIDPWTGYRLYSVDQIPILNKIIFLRDSGFNVAEIAVALQDLQNDALIQQLDKKYLDIEKNIAVEKEKLQKIRLAKNGILHEKDDMHYNVSIKSIPSYQVISLRKVIPNYYGEGDLWQELSAFIEQHSISVSNDTFSIFHDVEYKERDVDVEICAPVKESGIDCGNVKFHRTEAVPYMAYTMVYGKFENIAGAYLAFANWLQNNSQYRMSGPNRQIVHRGPWNEENPDKYLVELQIPLEKNQ
ncbi:MAG TPA: effector binding domain-containing protein [Candidatus Pelethocola excrementipullorum]|nr:effector binding domain-containing protein [Candidatus Pelethocola excrementipullorum]